MRFYVYKRALMLTAATVALLTGPAYAKTTTISKAAKDPLKTSTAGNITFDANGTLTIPSNTSVSTTPAVTINSNATVTMAAGSSIIYTGTPDAIGIFQQEGFKGESILGGTIDLTGDGISKTGVLLGSTTVGSKTFTGLTDSLNNTFTSDPTALVMQSGSVIKVQGDQSFGIRLSSGSKVVGDIVVNGTISVTPSTLNATSNSGVTTGIQLDGSLNGSLIVGTGGLVGSVGQGGQGVVVLGQVNGTIQNFGAITAAGSQTATTDKGNPLSGSGLVISNNVTSGFYNGGALSTSDTTTTAAAITTNGNQSSVLITPGFADTSSATPITIGGFADLGHQGTYSFINRGSILNTPLNVDVSSTALEISGLSSTADVTLTDGFFNSGTISSKVTGDFNAATPVATAIFIGNNVTIAPGGNTYAFVNSNDGAAPDVRNGTGVGTISASYTGSTLGAAAAITIATGANVPSFLNQGTINAVAVSSDSTISALSATGVLDQSGTLLTFVNQGTINAQATAVVNNATVALDNNNNIATAVNLSNASGHIDFTNNGTITGNVLLGGSSDTLTVSGTSSVPAILTGNINFGGGAGDKLVVGSHSTVTGDLLEGPGGHIDITVGTTGNLTVTNNGDTTNGQTIPTGTTRNLSVSNLDVQDGGTLALTLADGFNTNRTGNAGPIVQASSSAAVIKLETGSILKMNFGGFVSAPELSSGTQGTAKFVVFDASTGNLQIADTTQVQNALTSGIPFLFTGTACGYNLAGFTSCGAASTNPNGATHSDLVLSLTPKAPGVAVEKGGLGLTGYALAMFEPANLALANDAALGAAVINGGANIDATTKQGRAAGSKLYQQIYSAFAPDVTGSARAIAISLTDQASGIVGERQRKLRMYANQDGDTTLWAQEFGQRLNVPNKTTAAGYTNTGFGVAVGMDGGSISSGRYGGALTFYAGDTSEKVPRTSKTNSQWYMLTGYSDWRGKGLFFDSQVNVGYGNLTGKRTLKIDDPNTSGGVLIDRVAEGKRASELASGGFSTGFIFNSGGTVFMPQFSMDALTLREEGYTETGGGPGMDLHVEPYYANSVRAFLGGDIRQDLKFGGFYLQPDIRAGFRYDLLDGAQKLKVNFAGDPNTSPPVTAGSQFSITGPDPARGNLVLGGGLAVTTDAWSIGLNYDYQRGVVGGTKGGTSQDAMLTLIGRI